MIIDNYPMDMDMAKSKQCPYMACNDNSINRERAYTRGRWTTPTDSTDSNCTMVTAVGQLLIKFNVTTYTL